MADACSTGHLMMRTALPWAYKLFLDVLHQFATKLRDETE
jgi:hypothetical protein